MLFTRLTKIKLNRVLFPLILFIFVFIIYFGVGSKWTFKPPWGLDYFNPLAESLWAGRLDLPVVGTTYDLSYFQGKWYAPWGILPALFLIPLQLFKGRYVPIFYLSLLFSGLNIVAVYFLLRRVKEEFLPAFSFFSIILATLLFAFGTTHFYVGTLPSVWHVEQIISVFPALLGVYFISKRKRKPIDYFLSTSTISITFLAKANLVLLVFLPGFLYLFDHLKKKNLSARRIKIWLSKAILIFGPPLLIFVSLFFLYNYLRFAHPFENGYRYINESPHFAQIRQEHGIWSIKTIPRNLWYMVFEMPSLTFNGKIRLNFNLEGNSIFFLTPPLLAIFLASPLARKKRRLVLDPYISSLWLTLIISLIPILMIYSTGWMQFGYRYSLDFLVLLILLSVFGVKGKPNFLYFLGIIFAVWMQCLGISALR